MNSTRIPVIYRAIPLFCLSLLLSLPAWAGYVPTDPSAPTSPTTSTGRRGGCNRSPNSELIVLAPQTHVGETIASHPTLAWFVPETLPTPLEIYIYNITDTEQRQLIYKVELISTTGIMSHTLPDDEPGLKAGHRYFWQVVLLCNPNRPSSALVSTAELDVVSPTVDLNRQLHTLNTADYSDLDTFYQQRSRLYADMGLWYDALADSLRLTAPSQPDSILALLDDLNQYETSQNISNIPLQTVIDVLRSQP